ncbi:MAG TPA: thiamine diphosphokinase [Clostridia bacterium]|nr:thiamine diphosphokinase [Clostridia bacterium]
MSFPRIDALIALAGSKGPYDYFSRQLLESARTILAADGGACALTDLGYRPHMLVGDMDSLPAGYPLEGSGNEAIIRFPLDKDYTDGELATAAAILLAKGSNACDPVFKTDDGGQALYRAFQETSLAGLTLAYLNFAGYRYDHALANINLASLLAQRGAQVFLTDGTSLARLMTGPGKLEPVFPAWLFDVARQKSTGRSFHFSLLPLNDQVTGLTLKGLTWELDKVDLPPGRSLALSNRGSGLYPDQASLSLDKGTVMALTFPEGL